MKLTLVQYPGSMSSTFEHLLQSLPAMLRYFHGAIWITVEYGCLRVIRVNFLWENIFSRPELHKDCITANRKKIQCHTCDTLVHWSPLETYHWEFHCEFVMWVYYSQCVLKPQISRKKSGIQYKLCCLYKH